MADNPVKYGFQFVRSRHGSFNADIRIGWVPTATSFDVNAGAQNVVLGEGDPLVQLSTGGVTLAVGAETTPSSTCLGIVMGIKQYLDTVSNTMTAKGPGIPSDLAWGTDLSKQSQVLFCPAESAVWRVMCDDIVTATTEAAYQAFIGENVSMILTGAVGALRAAPKLDISTHATTNTLVWKIVGVPPNQDFSGANVLLDVICNLSSDEAILGI